MSGDETSVRSLDPDLAFSVPEAVLAREVAGETVILDTAAGIYFGLDAVGTRVWQLLTEGRPLGAVEAVLVEEFEVSRERLRRDLHALVGDLLDQGLLTRHSASSGRS